VIDHATRLQNLFGTPHPVALVTGSGARRVGNVIARTLAERGYRIAIHANRSLTEAQQTVAEMIAEGIEAIPFQADLTDERKARALIDETADAFGRLDVLVNSAAIWQRRPLETTTADDLRRHFEINTVATFVCAQQAGLRMVTQPSGGAIVNLGDWATARPYRDYSAYFPSKGAIPALTRDLAVELAHRNPRVRVNAVLPGPVMLPPELSDDERQAAINGTLVKREGSPQHVADAIVCLVENDFITGVCLPVDGGRTIAGPFG
jgi:pteridine reductase